MAQVECYLWIRQRLAEAGEGRGSSGAGAEAAASILVFVFLSNWSSGASRTLE